MSAAPPQRPLPPRRRVTPPRAAAPAAGNLLPIDGSLFFKLVRVVNLTARPFVETISRTRSLSLNEWRTMVVLASHPGAAASEVADLTGLDKMSVSRAVAGLVRRGRITRRTDPGDARRMPLVLSAAGRMLFEAIGGRAAEREAQLFGRVPPAELERFGAVIDRLIAALQELPEPAPARRPRKPAPEQRSKAEQTRAHGARRAARG